MIRYGFVILFGWVLAASCLAADQLAVVKSDGAVELGKPGRSAAKGGGEVQTISTGADGKAVVRVGNSYLVLGNNSKVEVGFAGKVAGFFKHVGGMVYYAFESVHGREAGPEVRTNLATIGIRGTRFLVVDEDGQSGIGMRKGVVSVTSLGEEFEVHRKAEQEDFESFKRQGTEAVEKEKSDFRTYQENTQKEFVEYKRQLSLEAGNMLSFSGNRVDAKALGGKTQDEMENLENYGNDWVSQVRD